MDDHYFGQIRRLFIQRPVSPKDLGNLKERLNRANLNSALNRFHEYPRGSNNPSYIKPSLSSPPQVINHPMRKLPFLLLCLSLSHPARADLTCTQAGNAAETAAALPTNMLVSIGMVESGRADALTGRVTPWPWTVNIDGLGHYFASKQDAVAFTRLAQSSGAGDIDVGCFQVSLNYHPNAFPNLDTAFDPAANAAYAAQFLNRLKALTGNWNTAIADYHSAVPDLGLPYQRRVLAAWHRIGSISSAIDDITLTAPDPVIILQSPAVRAATRNIHIITMDDTTPLTRNSFMPRIITP